MSKQSTQQVPTRMSLWRVCSVTLGVLALALPSLAQDWYWQGGTSANWSDLANWNSAADGSGSAPASTAALSNKKLMLLTTGANLPSNQDISGMIVNELMFTNSVTTFTISGQPIQINSRIFNTLPQPATVQTITFQNKLIINSTTAWVVRSTLRINLEGEFGEAGGSRYFAANENGYTHFLGPVTTTGGWRNNQSTAVFYGMETLGVAPGSLVDNFFQTGFGRFQFNSPDGNPYEYELGPTLGMRATGTINIQVPASVAVYVNAPISQDSGTRSINKEGNGVLYLKGANTFLGGISLTGGMVVMEGGIASGGGTVSANAGTLDLCGNDLLGRALSFPNTSGFDSSGILRNSKRNTTSTVNGNITTVSTSTVGLSFGGGGNIRHTGNITQANANNRLSKAGAGTLTLAGNSVYTGPIHVLGGTLALDYATDNGSKIGDSALLSIHGDLSIAGNASAPTVETLGNLVVGRLASASKTRIAVIGGGAQTATLRYRALDINGNCTVDFAPDATGSILSLYPTNSVNTGVLGSRATFKGQTFARAASSPDGNGYYAIEGLPSGSFGAAFDGGTNYEFVDVAGDLTLSGAETAAALRFDGAAASTLTLSANLRLRGENAGDSGYQGAILVTENVGSNATLIDGTGTLCFEGVNGWLHVHQYNTAAPLTISAPINNQTGGSSLSKNGPGELILTNAGNRFLYFGIYEGTLTVPEVANANAPSPIGVGPSLVLGTATLKYTGSGHSTDRTITLRGHGVIDASGTGALTFTAATPIASTDGNDHELTLTGSGEGEVQGTLNLKVGSLVKAGSGTWTLGGANSFWGGTRIDAGKLVVNGSLGRDVAVGADGTLAGSGSIGRNLTVDGTLAVNLDEGGISVGRHADISGATLTVTGTAGDTPVAVLACSGTLTGEFASVSEGYIATYSDGTVQITSAPPGGTVLLVR